METLRSRIDLWSVDLASARDHIRTLARDLGPEDLQQSSKYRCSEDAERFILRRAVLRHILSRYAQVPAASLALRHGPFGKPYLVRGPGASSGRFSASSRGELAIIGIAPGSDLGVDIERIEPALLDDTLLERVLTATERAALDALPPRQRVAAFFASWVQKEALLKAVGWGLQVDPRQLDLPVVGELSSAWMPTAQVAFAGRRWSIQVCARPSGYVMAVATEAAWPEIRLIQWQWAPPVVPCPTA